MMLASRSKDQALARRCIGLSAGGFAVCLAAATLAAGTAGAESSNAIPPFASANFGWQSNFEDWEEPPPGTGHGPIKNDPAYPFRNNTEGNRAGTGATKRITNTKDPVLKPWAAAQIQATNDEILQGVRDIPFTAQARCSPGGVPGHLLWPFEPAYFIQSHTALWLICHRDGRARHWRRPLSSPVSLWNTPRLPRPGNRSGTRTPATRWGSMPPVPPPRSATPTTFAHRTARSCKWRSPPPATRAAKARPRW